MQDLDQDGMQDPLIGGHRQVLNHQDLTLHRQAGTHQLVAHLVPKVLLEVTGHLAGVLELLIGAPQARHMERTNGGMVDGEQRGVLSASSLKETLQMAQERLWKV